jgi:hypothetical protein
VIVESQVLDENTARRLLDPRRMTTLVPDDDDD